MDDYSFRFDVFFCTNVLTRFIPIAILVLLLQNLIKQRRNRAIRILLMLFLRHSIIHKIKDVAKMFTSNGCKVSFAGVINYHENCYSYVVRAIKVIKCQP